MFITVTQKTGKESLNRDSQVYRNGFSKYDEDYSKVIDGSDYRIVMSYSRNSWDRYIGDTGMLLGNIYGTDYDSIVENPQSIINGYINLWKSQGVHFLNDINGSFAVFLHDSETEETLISTDRFATYPLWYIKLDDDQIAVSSEFYALSKLIKGTIDLASLWSFLTRARPVGQRSFYEQIRGIRPGTAWLFKKGKFQKRVEWYKPCFKPEHQRSLSYWGGELAGRIEATMHDQLKKANCPGLLLSGGLDSRLLASLAPNNTKCFTLADFNNREMKIAAKVARICELKHFPIIRNKDWYPSLLEYSVRNSIGLWHWHNMHFIPMQTIKGEWSDVDRVILGMGFDTFFKGNQISSPVLWHKKYDQMKQDEMVTYLINYGTSPLSQEKDMASIMHPEAVLLCKNDYRKALYEEIINVLPMGNCLPDIWDMVEFRAFYRVPYFTNLTCLRDFIDTRNIIEIVPLSVEIHSSGKNDYYIILGYRCTFGNQFLQGIY